MVSGRVGNVRYCPLSKELVGAAWVGPCNLVEVGGERAECGGNIRTDQWINVSGGEDSVYHS